MAQIDAYAIDFATDKRRMRASWSTIAKMLGVSEPSLRAACEAKLELCTPAEAPPPPPPPLSPRQVEMILDAVRARLVAYRAKRLAGLMAVARALLTDCVTSAEVAARTQYAVADTNRLLLILEDASVAKRRRLGAGGAYSWSITVEADGSAACG